MKGRDESRMRAYVIEVYGEDVADLVDHYQAQGDAPFEALGHALTDLRAEELADTAGAASKPFGS